MEIGEVGVCVCVPLHRIPAHFFFEYFEFVKIIIVAIWINLDQPNGRWLAEESSGFDGHGSTCFPFDKSLNEEVIWRGKNEEKNSSEKSILVDIFFGVLAFSK